MAELQEAEIRARIKRARKEAGLSQPAMAELLGVIPRTVQNYENDHVPWSRIRDIADITGRSTRWLLHGDTEAADDESELALQLGRLKTEVAEIKPTLEAISEQLQDLWRELVVRAREESQRIDEGDQQGGESQPEPQP